MKVSYKKISAYINPRPDINELSEKLFQLGHEHEIVNEIFDFEFTPNRGDCLSINGLLRDLKLFYKVSFNENTYIEKIKPYDIKFINNARSSCPYISFMKVEIKDLPEIYNGELEDFFLHNDQKKNNFFTDVSNYISYETGQPTHCYDSSKLNDYIKLEFKNGNHKFETLFDKTIELKGKNLVFYDSNENIINLAGVVGEKSTACNQNTTSVIVECAYFIPEDIIGKSVKYNLISDAAHKFERNTDPGCHEDVLRRFIKIIEDHAEIKNLELYSYNKQPIKKRTIKYDHKRINKILGTKISKEDCNKFFTKLGFIVHENFLEVPTYRNDLRSINDLSEEIARAIGYNNINATELKVISESQSNNINCNEKKIKNLLVDNGFFEVINNPFIDQSNPRSISVDNPLDSNKKYLRTDLKNSLIKNLLYNERRQKESIKLFEIADVYLSNDFSSKRIVGIITSGRVANNYKDFTNKMDESYISNLLNACIPDTNFECINISRDLINSKTRDLITYVEIEFNSDLNVKYRDQIYNHWSIDKYKYKPVPELPSSKRDLSFSIKDYSKLSVLENFILSYKHCLLKEVFIFDYFLNEKKHEIKIGFRFIFQSRDVTITDNEVDEVLNNIIQKALEYESISIPGLS